jgi:hypothetical protein
MSDWSDIDQFPNDAKNDAEDARAQENLRPVEPAMRKHYKIADLAA